MEDENKLPKGWTTGILQDLLDYIQPTNYIVESTNYDDKYKTPVLTAGKSFILGRTNETEGIFQDLPVIIFDDFTTATKFVNFPFKVKSSAMKILKPTNDFVNILYAYYFMQTIRITVDTHKRYWISNYSQLPIPIPPYNEQTRIVEKIEELFSELDNGIQNLKTAKEQLKVYRQSVLKWAFEGKLTEIWRENNKDKFESAEKLLERIKSERQKRYEQQIEDWKMALTEWEDNGKQSEKPNKPKRPYNLDPKNKIIDGLIDKEIIPQEWIFTPLVFVSDNIPDAIVDGPFGSSINVNEDYKDEGVPVIRMINIRPLKYKNENLKFISKEKFETLKRHNILSGDILIAKVGATIGDCCIYPDKQPEAMLSTTGSCRIRVDLSIYKNKYIEYYIFYKTGLLKKIASQTAQPFLNMEILKSFPIPLFSISEQNVLIQEIEQLFSVIEKLEQTIEDNLQKADALRQSILKKAFEGKLVAQDLNDEPANALIERIKQEKSQIVKIKHVRSKKMPEELKSIIDILNDSQKPVPAKDVWLKSIHKDDIEEFYAELKKLQNEVNIETHEKESLLSLKK